MNNTYQKLTRSLRGLSGWVDQIKSIAYWIILWIIVLPIAWVLVILGGSAIFEINNAKQVDSAMPWIVSCSIGIFLIYKIFTGLSIDFQIILLLKKLKKFNTSLKKHTTEKLDVESILDSLESIHSIVHKIYLLKKYNYVSSKYYFLHKIEVKYCMEILADLRSDLSLRLTEQQQTLEWAKMEVERNIGWTLGLEEVSDLQKARLDKQIEQFEELQRTLVRV